jgi:hypothetical protein
MVKLDEVDEMMEGKKIINYLTNSQLEPPF